MNLLLICKDDKTYLLENKCGHFGVTLNDAKIEWHQNKMVIVCVQHGISFDLNTGQVINRPWENCESIKVITIVIEDGILGFYPDSFDTSEKIT